MENYILGCGYKTDCEQRKRVAGSKHLDIKEFDRELCDGDYDSCSHRISRMELNKLPAFHFN